MTLSRWLDRLSTTKRLSKDAHRVFLYLISKQKIGVFTFRAVSQAEVSQTLNIRQPNVCRALKNLVESRFLEQIGEKYHREYRLIRTKE